MMCRDNGVVDALLEAESLQISWLPRITARKLRSVMLKLLKVIGFITKSSNEPNFAYQHLHKNI